MRRDTATVQRTVADASSNSMRTETVYEGISCHLSARSGLGANSKTSLKQTEAQAQARAGYTVFLSPDVKVLPGDLLTINHRHITVSGRAGIATYGNFGVRVPIDSVVIA